MPLTSLPLPAPPSLSPPHTHTHSKKIQKIKTSTPFTLSYIATANNPLINWSQIVQAQTFTAFHSLIHQHTQTPPSKTLEYVVLLNKLKWRERWNVLAHDSSNEYSMFLDFWTPCCMHHNWTLPQGVPEELPSLCPSPEGENNTIIRFKF